MKYLVLSIILFVTIFAFTDLANAAPIAPVIVVSPEVWDLGQVFQESAYSKTFRIYNNGDSALIINKIRPTCGCTTTQITSGEVLAGSSISFEAHFKTGSVSGEVQRRIYIQSNDPLKPISLIKIIGNVLQKK
jgi:hypothetical protein